LYYYMNRNNVILIISIFIIIFVSKLMSIRMFEHLTPISDEAIQNVASLYNTDKLTIGNLVVTSNGKIAGIDADNANITTATITTGTIPTLTSTNAAVSGTLSGPTINSIVNRLNALEAKTASLNSNGTNLVYRGTAFRMKSNAGSTPVIPGTGYGPYFYAGNHDQSLWRDPNYNHPLHTPDHFSFTIE
jgi:hypothetical protein